MQYLPKLVLSCCCSLASVAALAEPRQPGPHAPSAASKNPVETNEASLKQGQALYKQYCITCHAADGSGKTDMTEMLDVPPASFMDTEWKYGSTDGEMFSVIKDGGQNGMQPFSDKITDTRIWNLINYIRTLSKPASGAPGPAAPKEEIPQNPIAYSPESVALGKQYYARNCVVCHGMNGKGDTEMREFLSTHPSDLTDSEWKYGGEDGHLFLVIKNGTEYDMKPFKGVLDDEKTWHVVNYLRSFAKKK
jgi:mono/diheme cytochrome c family protein